jgi:hypothetical protein
VAGPGLVLATSDFQTYIGFYQQASAGPADPLPARSGAIGFSGTLSHLYVHNDVSGSNLYLETSGTGTVFLNSVDSELLPRGRRGYDQFVATVPLSGTLLGVGLSSTIAADATRRYKVRAKLSAQSTVAGDVVRFVLLHGTTQVDLAQVTVSPANSFVGPIFLEKTYDTGTLSGTVSFSVQGQRFAGTGNCQITAQGGIPCFLEVTDEGKA